MDDYDRFVIFSLARSRDRPPALNHLGQPSAWFVRSVQSDLDALEAHMAKRTNRPARSPQTWAETTFVDIRLDNKAKTHFNQWMEQGNDEISLLLATFVSNDHKLSLSWDDQNVCFVASATCKDEQSPNHNCCISSRSQDWFEAIALTLYKASVLLGETPWTDVKNDRSWG